MANNTNNIASDEKIIGVVGHIRRYAPFWIRDWFAGVTDRGGVIFVSSYCPPVGEAGTAALISKPSLEGKTVGEAMQLRNRKIYFAPADFGKIVMRKKPLVRDQIWFVLDGQPVKLVIRRKQYNILDGIINKKQTYKQALETSGPDYARAKYLIFLVIALIIFFAFYLTRFRPM